MDWDDFKGRDRFDGERTRGNLFERLDEFSPEEGRRTGRRGGDDFDRHSNARAFSDEYVGLGNVVIHKPKTYNDVQAMIEDLRLKEPIIFNLEGIANESAQRILDFMSGAAYAIGGSMRRIKEYMFIVTPQGTGITDRNDTDNNH